MSQGSEIETALVGQNEISVVSPTLRPESREHSPIQATSLDVWVMRRNCHMTLPKERRVALVLFNVEKTFSRSNAVLLLSRMVMTTPSSKTSAGKHR